MQETTQIRIEAEVFRRLLQHLHERKDGQNIDLMDLAHSCRNCRAKWHFAAAGNHAAELDLGQARKIVYGTPNAEWKRLYQKGNTAEQLQAFTESGRGPGKSDA